MISHSTGSGAEAMSFSMSSTKLFAFA